MMFSVWTREHIISFLQDGLDQLNSVPLSSAKYDICSMQIGIKLWVFFFSSRHEIIHTNWGEKCLTIYVNDLCFQMILRTYYVLVICLLAICYWKILPSSWLRVSQDRSFFLHWAPPNLVARFCATYGNGSCLGTSLFHLGQENSLNSGDYDKQIGYVFTVERRHLPGFWQVF